MNSSQESSDCFSSSPVNQPIDLTSLFGGNDLFDQPPSNCVEPPPVVISFQKTKKTNKAPSSLSMTNSEWPTLVQEYDALMSSKDTIDRRRFNKTALVLLSKFAATARGSAILTNPLNEPAVSQFRDDTKEALGEFRDLVLNAREMAIDDLSGRVVTFIDKGLSPNLTAEERKEELQKKSLSFLIELSPQLGIKAGAAVKSYISRLFGSDIDELLAEVRLPEMSLRDKTDMYTRMFENLMDDPRCVSFAASNIQLLGQLEPVDIWFLTFFAFVTVKRSRGDNLLMLGCVGKIKVIIIMA